MASKDPPADVQTTMRLTVMPNTSLGRPSLLVLRGTTIGAQYPLDRDELVIGRGDEAQIRVRHDNVSRQHARVRQTEAGWVVEDLGSTNGTYVNDQTVTTHLLVEGDLIQIGETVLKYLSPESVESQYHENVYRMATHDSLTGAYNKTFFVRALSGEINRSNRHRHPVSVVLLDVDHFKVINDTHGHLAGDRILIELAELLREAIREEDIFARFGGEEFSVLLPETDHDAAVNTCERLRQKIADHAFAHGGTTIPVTASFGVCTIQTGADGTVDKFLKEADARLYEAKAAGRNCVR